MKATTQHPRVQSQDKDDQDSGTELLSASAALVFIPVDTLQ